jgi:glutamate racemase
MMDFLGKATYELSPTRLWPYNYGNECEEKHRRSRRKNKKAEAMAVGIFDSGLGGLTVLDAVQKRLPDVPFVYFGDNAHAPYGVRDADDVYDLTTKSVERMWEAGCDLVILACNTASAAALRRVQESWIPRDKRVLGVFVPLIEALTERKWGDNSPPREVAVKHVALFATPATVASRAFQRELAFRAIGVDVEAQACGGVVDAIEDGDLILAEALVRSHVDALKRKMPHPDAAILGCTHYPLMQDQFQDALGPDVTVFSQANLVASSLADYLDRHPEMRGPGTQSMFLTTGDPAKVSNSATQFLRRKIDFQAA